MTRKKIAVACFLVFLAALNAGLVMPILPIFIHFNLGTSIATAGFLMSLISLPQLVIRIPFSVLSDRFGRKPFMATGLLLYGITCTAYSLVQSPFQISMFLLLHGLGMASYWPASLAWLGDLTQSLKKSQVGTVVGIYTSVFGAAFTIGSVIGGYIVENFGFVQDFRIAALVGVLGGIITLLIVKNVKVIEKQGDIHYKSRGLNLRRGLKAFTSNETMLMALVTIFIASLIIPAIAVFFPLYGKSIGMGETLIGLAIMANTGFSSLARIPGGQLSNRMNSTILVSGAILLLSAGVFWIPFSNSYPLMILCLSLAGIGSGVLLAATTTMIIEAAHPSDRGFAMGLEGTIRHIGRVVAPILMGLVAEKSGLRAPFILGAILGSIGLIATIIRILSIKRQNK